MLELGSISFTVFSYVTEENNRVVEALYNCIPTIYHNEKLTKITSNSQFGDPLVIYSFETDDFSMMNDILQHIGDLMDDKSRQYLTRTLVKKTDLENRTVYLRLDKYKAYEGHIFVTEGSDIIKVEISYNAYTKGDNDFENVNSIFQKYNMVQ